MQKQELSEVQSVPQGHAQTLVEKNFPRTSDVRISKLSITQSRFSTNKVAMYIDEHFEQLVRWPAVDRVPVAHQNS